MEMQLEEMSISAKATQDDKLDNLIANMNAMMMTMQSMSNSIAGLHRQGMETEIRISKFEEKLKNAPARAPARASASEDDENESISSMGSQTSAITVEEVTKKMYCNVVEIRDALIRDRAMKKYDKLRKKECNCQTENGNTKFFLKLETYTLHMKMIHGVNLSSYFVDKQKEEDAE